MIMNENFITFELSKELKEKGFPQRPYYFNYNSYYEWNDLREKHSLSHVGVWFDPNINRENIYFAPTISQVLEWLREEKKIFICIDISHPYSEDNVFAYKYRFYMTNLLNQDRESDFKVYDTYEGAALAGIEYILNNVI